MANELFGMLTGKVDIPRSVSLAGLLSATVFVAIFWYQTNTQILQIKDSVLEVKHAIVELKKSYIEADKNNERRLTKLETLMHVDRLQTSTAP